jgi:sulfite exporter TauE/SafE
MLTDVTININFITAFSIGLLGSLHCVGMCGGISGALATAMTPPTSSSSTLINTLRKLSFQLFYSCGRIGSYMVAGALVGGIGATMNHFSSGHSISVLRILSGVMLILLGFYISGWWMALAKLERIGSVIWKRIRPLTRPLMPVNTAWKAMALGALWGWLPCGLVYSGLAWSITSGDIVDGALLMFYFGLGTVPAMVGIGFFSSMLADFARSKTTRSVAGILMIIYGSWTIWGNLSIDHESVNHKGMNHNNMNHIK